MPLLPSIAQCAADLARDLPVEDIWFFESAKAPECGFRRPFQLVVLLDDAADREREETRAEEIIGDRGREISVHAFPQSALYRLPRPLLLKMALTAGRCIFQK